MTKFEMQQKILNGPFDIETHSKYFINYCEVIIWPDGKIEYCVPSHNEKLIQVYAQQHGLSRDDAVQELQVRYGIDAIYEIMKETGIIEIWDDYLHNETRLTDAQIKAVNELIEHECISDKCLSYIKVL